MEKKLFRFKRQNNAIEFNEIGKPEGEERDMREINRDGWVFLVDDEIATGGTTKSALYVLVHKLGFKAHRILTSWVHGKFPKGLAPIVSQETYSSREVIEGIANGTLLKNESVVDEEAMTDHDKKQMMPFFIATTNSFFSESAVRGVIDLKKFFSVNLYRLFAFGLGNATNADAVPLTSA
jgi:phosphoribosylpyrophosphate synthetase